METLTHIPPRDATGIHQGPHYVTAKPQAVATVRGREQLLLDYLDIINKN
jgi:hypothetical protein